tara:strand:+ start:4422 stop:5417 length:996 start_codon:yes stop_codon:yes gene_type:complete
MSEQATQTNLPMGESENVRETFRDRKAAELNKEKGLDAPPVQNSQPEVGRQSEIDDAHQPELEDDYSESLDEQPTDDQTDDGVDEPPVPEPGSWEAKYHEAEDLRQKMQTDYTQKTQELANKNRQLRDDIQLNEGISQSYLSAAEQQVQFWAGTDWNHLQRTMDPRQYQLEVQKYQKAINDRDQMQRFHNDIVERHKAQQTKVREHEIEVSSDILATTIPNWGQDTYQSVAQFSIDKLGWTEQEFMDITDHKVMSALHYRWSTENANSRVQNIKRESSQQPPASGRNKAQQGRSSDGKFRSARQEMIDNPNVRGSARNYFMEKLKRESEGR